VLAASDKRSVLSAEAYKSNDVFRKIKAHYLILELCKTVIQLITNYNYNVNIVLNSINNYIS